MKNIYEYRLGIDLGGTKIRFIVLDRQNLIRLDHEIPTPRNSGGVDISKLLTAIIDCLMICDQNHLPIHSIGLGSPGLVDPIGGTVISPINLGWKTKLSVIELLHSKIDLPIALLNDVACATIAEHELGAGRGKSYMAYINLGTGIGSGIILNNQLVVGQGFGAGEIGHFSVDPNGGLCACGQRGCLEVFSSGLAIANQYHIKQSKDSGKLNSISIITAKEIASRAENGDTHAMDVFRDAGEYLLAALSGLSNLLDLQEIIIGGGVSQSWGLLFPKKDQLTRGVNITRISQCRLGQNAGCVGAALVGAMDLKTLISNS